MFKDKRGLSAVVTTLLIILLVLVAVGIIWVVVRGVVETGTEQIDVSARCLSVDIRATEVIETSAGVYDVTLMRRSGGDDIDGVVVNVFNDTESSGIVDFGVAIGELDTETQSVDTSLETQVLNGNRIEFTVYINDASGNQQFCTQIGEYNF